MDSVIKVCDLNIRSLHSLNQLYIVHRLQLFLPLLIFDFLLRGLSVDQWLRRRSCRWSDGWSLCCRSNGQAGEPFRCFLFRNCGRRMDNWSKISTIEYQENLEDCRLYFKKLTIANWESNIPALSLKFCQNRSPPSCLNLTISLNLIVCISG